MANAHKLNRTELINSILKDLRKFRSSCNYEQKYAVDENIKFFEAVRHLWRYIPWLIREYPKIDKARIKELADFQLHHGLWEEYLLRDLVRLEKSRFIDLVAPLRKELLQHLRKSSVLGTRPLVVVNAGCGAMEIERQIVKYLTKSPLRVPIVLVGVDNSVAALTMAQRNLRQYKEFFGVSKELSSKPITRLQQSGRPYEIQFILGDVTTFLSRMSPGALDVVYYSKFLHHLSDQDKIKFKKLLVSVAKSVIEFDDYRGVYLPIMSLLTNWRSPILLNGAVFSALRVPDRAMLLKDRDNMGWETKIFPLKGYIKTYQDSSFTDE